jgi:phospholipid/cholesterol/gamma-HCH transport system substrate-binding protein
VALVERRSNAERGLEDGTVIPPERVHTSVELSRVLARLFPLLRAVRPADLSATLTALATALNGRGEQLGEMLESLDAYLADLNLHLPTLQEDLRLLADVASTYELAAPDLLAALANLTVTADTIVEKDDALGTLFGEVAGMARVGTRVLATNETQLVRFAELSVPTLALLDKYAPEYNCLFRGLYRFHPRLNKTFEGGAVKQFVEVPTPQVRGYDGRDVPEYADERGPRCLGLPYDVSPRNPFSDLANGTTMDTAKGRGYTYMPGGGTTPVSVTQQRATTALLSDRVGRSAEDIPALSVLMYAPLVDGVPGA